MPDGPVLHPACEPFAVLLGTWSGQGAGEYPTIEDFEYFEEVSFGHVGKPFLAYTQRTRHAHTGLPLHSEAGYLRPTGDGEVELVLAQPSGILEVDLGSFDGRRLELRSVEVVRSPTAKEVTEVWRDIEVDGDVLTYEVHMAAVGQPCLLHLRAELHRDGAPARGTSTTAR
jgi:hypothetical protein